MRKPMLKWTKPDIHGYSRAQCGRITVSVRLVRVPNEQAPDGFAFMWIIGENESDMWCDAEDAQLACERDLRVSAKAILEALKRKCN